MSRLLCLLLCVFLVQNASSKPLTDSSIMSIEYPISSAENKFTQRLAYKTTLDTTVNIHVDCYYMLNLRDSIHLYDLTFEQIRLHAGPGFVDLPFAKAVSSHKMHAAFFEVISRFSMVPAGVYRTHIDIRSMADQHPVLLKQELVQYVDSNLSYSSGLRDQLNAAMALPASATKKVAQSVKQSTSSSQPATDAQLQTSEKKLKRQLRNIKGLELRTAKIAGKVYSEAWYKSFFLGRYELAAASALSERANNEAKRLESDASSMVKNELEDFRGVGSQIRDLYGKNSRETKMKGFIDISTNHANTTDPNSAVDPDYTEILLNTDIELKGLPVSVEAFYTTQDQHRQAKASYIRFHYDVETAKSKLQNIITGYKTKMNETISKGQGLDQVYGNYANQLEQQKSGMLKSLGKEYNIDPKALMDNKGDVGKVIADLPKSVDTTGLAAQVKGQLQGKADSNSTAEVLKQKEQALKEQKAKLEKDRKTIEDKYAKILALEQKIEKYRALLAKYKTQNSLDSSLNYSKLAKLDQKDASYKDMSKAAAGLLPEGQVKGFVTGLTSFDVGIINKYESDYTMAGQTLKGLSLGYDIGIAKVGISAGSAEYASRDGNLDRYSTLLLRVDSKNLKNHKISLIYNGNTPSRTMLKDENFIGNAGVAYPSFTAPTHIGSLVYDGLINKTILLHSELASSYKAGQTDFLDLDHDAVNMALEYHMPKVGLDWKGALEHLGRSFENNVLPYVQTATEKYTLGTGIDLFRSFLSINVDYNYLIQQSFSSTGISQKWGIDAKTHSKQYPNLSFSYKPFSTFRSYADTFNIPQRPMLGEVWTGRGTYQIKHGKRVHRFTVLFNKNSSSSDTLHYSASTAQASYNYTCPAISVNGSFSRIELPVNFADGTGMMSSYVLGAGIGKQISPSVHLSFNPDLSFCSWGIQRISSTLGVAYKFQNKPLAIRILLRYATYKTKQTDPTTGLYAGQLGINWQFKSNNTKDKR